MNRQDAKDAKEEPDKELDRLATTVIGAAIEVHRHRGPGYLEALHEEALAVEFGIRRLSFKRQHPVCVTCKSAAVGQSKLDFLVGYRLIVELKSVEGLLPIHRAELISYLKATNCTLGLLINFNETRLVQG
jgi:GxxExxY protein